ncbi:diacylglycerol/lipid kinase family protein [Streptomyces sp. NPDC059002]|uniref:diacylglycerol/lipid kinase family protein n=1 Tax=Streptomyces sp. NPDC059002 TaxID=3346690 RepID=UPI0036A7769A
MGELRVRGARRAALRGAGALVLAAGAARAVGSAVRGLRPGAGVPPVDGAAWAAFATGAALESPPLGAVLAPAAGGLLVCRVRSGRTAPGDALAAAVGGIGLAAVTCRWWPLRRDEPADTARPNVPVPTLRAGKGLIAVVNCDAGGDAPADAELRDLLPEAELRLCDSDDDLRAVLRRAAGDALAGGGALGTVGGDGTVNTAAVIAADVGVPLAVFPGGTLNHFAADLGLRTLQDTAAAVEAGHGGAIDLGRVTADGTSGRTPVTYFLNTFSIGVYPELVRAREAREARLGKWPALGVGLVRVLTGATPTEVTVDGRRRRLWLLFAGNSRYDPPGFAPTYRRSLDDGLLDIRTVDGGHPFARTRLVAAFLTGTLATSRVYEARTAARVRIEGMGAGEDYSRDGEVSPGDGTLVVDKRPCAVTVYLPAPS